MLAAWETAYRAVGVARLRSFPPPATSLDFALGMLNIHTAFGEPAPPRLARVAGSDPAEPPTLAGSASSR